MANTFKGSRGRKEHAAIILVFAILALFIVATTYYGTRLLSAVRAYVGAESQWTKAQKEAVGLLFQYLVEQDADLYRRFDETLELHEAFKTSRETLISEQPDRGLATRGFQTADLHPDDIELIVWLARFRSDIPYIERAYDIWREGDRRIANLRDIARDAKGAVEAGRMEGELRSEFIREIASVDRELTELETAFSATMAERARATRSVLFRLIVGTGAVLVVLGYAVTSVLFRRMNRLNRELLESESRFRRVLRHSRDVVYELDIRSWSYEYMSPAVESMLGYSMDRILAGGPEFVREHIHPEDREYMEEEIGKLKRAGVSDHFTGEQEYRIRTKEGNYIWVHNQRKLVTDDNGDPVAVVGTVRDISGRKEREAQLQRSLDEKRTLLAEIHHRVKNNLAVMSSLLALQKNQTTGEIHHILQDTESRIRSIAMIHEKLYQTDTFSEVDMKEYIDDFVGILAYSFASQYREIAIRQDVERILLDITRAVPLGLILNELLNNAFKHGLANTERGEVAIALKRHGERGVLSVTNSGAGLPADFDIENVESLGMTLVRTLTEQLNGEVRVTRNGATTFRIAFNIG